MATGWVPMSALHCAGGAVLRTLLVRCLPLLFWQLKQAASQRPVYAAAGCGGTTCHCMHV